MIQLKIIFEICIERMEVTKMKIIQYKIDVMKVLKENGYSSTKLRKEKIFGEATMTQFRKGILVSWMNMNRLCNLLDCDISDVIQCVDVEETED